MLHHALAAVLGITSKVVDRGKHVIRGSFEAADPRPSLGLTSVRSFAAVLRILMLNDAVHVLELDGQALIRGALLHAVGAAHAGLSLRGAVLGVEGSLLTCTQMAFFVFLVDYLLIQGHASHLLLH